MLTWNNHDTFKRSLQSMTSLLLDDRVCELLILDNGSHEMSLRNLLERTEKMYSKVKVFYSSENLGIAKGRKFLFDACQGEYILSFDSDIVIVDANNLLHVLTEVFKKPEIWLVGGGGGNHPFFPTHFREDINNLKEADNPGQLTFVDEVAGWFHGFRSSMLVKNGGKVYMDERFTPFWGEDSDFCLQIRLLGGKCGIVGRGLVAHQWSSCDKKHVQKTIDGMWKKFVDKWYPKFGDIFEFPFDEDFYQKMYKKHIKHGLPSSDYFLDGIRKGFIATPDVFRILFNAFYNGENVVLDKENISPEKFIDTYMNKEMIYKYNFKELSDPSDLKSNKWLITLASNNDNNALEVLQRLNQHNQDFALALISNNNHDKTIQYIKNNIPNHYICQFDNYDNHNVQLMALMDHLPINTFDKILTINSNYKGGKFLENSLYLCEANGYLGEKVKTDSRGIYLIHKVSRFYNEIEYYKDGCFIGNFQKLYDYCKTIPMQNVLHICLMMPFDYTIHVSPRYAPKYTLEKLLGHHVINPIDKNALVVYNCNIESFNDIDRISKNNEKIKQHLEGDILIMNSGTLRHIKPAELNTDYYYLCNQDSNKNNIYKQALGMAGIDSYSNVIFMNDGFVIEDDLQEFIEYSYYSNKFLIKDDERLLDVIFSVTIKDLGMYFKMFDDINKMGEDDKTKNIDKGKTLDINMIRNFGFDTIWMKTEEDLEDEKVLSYTREDDKFEPDIDFPITEEISEI